MLTDITNKQSPVVLYPTRRIIRAWKRSMPTDVRLACEYMGPTRAVALQMRMKDFVLTMHSPGVLENIKVVLKRVFFRANTKLGLTYEQRLLCPSSDLDTKLFVGAYLVACFPVHTLGMEISSKDQDFQRAGAQLADSFDAVLAAMRAEREPDYAAFIAGARAYLHEAKTWAPSPRLMEEFKLMCTVIELEEAALSLERMGTPGALDAATEMHLKAGKARVQLRKVGGQPAVENADLRLCLRAMQAMQASAI